MICNYQERELRLPPFGSVTLALGTPEKSLVRSPVDIQELKSAWLAVAYACRGDAAAGQLDREGRSASLPIASMARRTSSHESQGGK